MWLNISFTTILRLRRTMAHYELTFTVPSPGRHTTFTEFSPCGRFLAVGDRDVSSLYILDRGAGFHPTLSAITPAKPTSLVWEDSQVFYVGLGDGRFMHYRIDSKDKTLVEGITNDSFRGAFPITAMALDIESKTLVLSVGPGVFAFRKIRTTSMCHLRMNWNSRLTLLKANFASSAPYQAVSIFQAILEVRPPHSQDPFLLPPTIRSLSRFAANI